MQNDAQTVDPLMAAKTALYRHFDADGALLYVGVSLSPLTRTSHHSQSASWFDLVASVTIEWFDNRSAALDAECLAIFMENPRFNTIMPIERLRTFFCPLTDKPKERLDSDLPEQNSQGSFKASTKKILGFTDESINRIDDWRRKQPVIPTFSDAVRALIRTGLDREARRHAAAQRAAPDQPTS